MSAHDDERSRFGRAYRDLAAQELLRLYEARETLSPVAADCLRAELRLRGLDPDSLRATVPKASDVDGPIDSGDASLADADPERGDGDPEVVEEEPSKSHKVGRKAARAAAESAETAEPPPPAALRCASCGARNAPQEESCARCGRPLAESASHQTMKRRITDTHVAVRPSGTLGSATAGVIGVSALVFSGYSLTLDRVIPVVSAGVAGAGIVALAVAVWLYASKRRRDAGPASTN